MPQRLAREGCPFGESSELRPPNLGMHPTSHAAVGPADDILAPDNRRPIDEPAIVGRENVVGGADRGMGCRVHAEIGWSKLAALVEGAALATKTLRN